MSQPESTSLRSLYEKHDFKKGDHVIVCERYKPDISYKGKVYSIVNLPMNKYIKQYKNIFVDYFYISFPEEIYDKLLKQGLEVIYQHNPIIIGNIETDEDGKIQKIHAQNSGPLLYETYEIDLQNINAILVWRHAYEIKNELW
jgi:hypothetical protein